MKNNFIYSFYILIFVLNSSCNRLNKDSVSYISNGEVEIINVDIHNKVPFDSVVKDFKHTKLEENDNALFGYITKLRVFKNRIYILDNITTDMVYIFNTNGKHIKTIDNKGRASNEFIGIKNFELDYINDELIMHDVSGHKLMFYDLEGNFKRSRSIDWSMEDYASLADGRIVRGRTPFSHLIYNNNLESDNLLVISDSVSSIPCEYNLQFPLQCINSLVSCYNGDVSFIPLLSDTIYNVNIKGYYPEYVINIDTPNKISIKEFSEFNGFNMVIDAEKNRSKLFTCGGLTQNDKFVALSLGFFNSYSLFYSKTSENSFIIEDVLFNHSLASDENGLFWASIPAVYANQSNSSLLKTALSTVSETNSNILVCFDLNNF